MTHLHESKVAFLEEMANQIRQDVIEMVANVGSGHIGGPLSMADIFAAL